MRIIRSTVFAVVCAAISLTMTVTPVGADAPAVRVLMDWFNQADQGGFWQEQIDDLGKPYGLNIQVLQGGPKIQTIPQVASGQAEFGIANADDVILARLHGAPVRAIFAFMNYVPYDLVYHPDSKVKTLADLKDKTFAVNLGFGYWEWLKKRYGMTSAHEIPVSGDLTLFKLDPNMVQQGYSIFLPTRLDALGIPNAQLRVADLGYRPYATLITTDDMIKNHPDVVRNMIAAAKKGWQTFLSDPSKANALTLSMNTQMTAQINDHAVAEMKDLLEPHDRTQIGCMTDARWTELTKQLQEVSLVPAGFDPKQAYTRSFETGCR
jgi:NitT/TauT family transport system substrate-binding protein